MVEGICDLRVSWKLMRTCWSCLTLVLRFRGGYVDFSCGAADAGFAVFPVVEKMALFLLVFLSILSRALSFLLSSQFLSTKTDRIRALNRERSAHP